MNRRFRSLLSTVLVMWLMSNLQADAAISYRIELSEGTGILQDVRPSVSGESLTANVILELDGDTTLANYSVSLGFDPTELSYVTGSETPPSPLSSLNALSLNITVPSQPEVDGIEAGTLGPTGASVGIYTIASLTFNILTPLGDATDVDLILFDDELLDGSFDQEFNLLVPVYGGASITAVAVPEPSTFSLGVACVVGTLTKRRRRRQSVRFRVA
ncbi:hypothetical protein CA13_65190 [Planctomycetes bacterium CA13]|uniref:PEP-CTERM protein-sorting domain-containing protein n=1 Tax=Novipirellula herctigrandis TaxID=2527986 RepID=A0A5C5ZD91_9BACT|nr:hypothetical protein CA13_65190 [Planctomycetes bacterium CA13]